MYFYVLHSSSPSLVSLSASFYLHAPHFLPHTIILSPFFLSCHLLCSLHPIFSSSLVQSSLSFSFLSFLLFLSFPSTHPPAVFSHSPFSSMSSDPISSAPFQTNPSTSLSLSPVFTPRHLITSPISFFHLLFITPLFSSLLFLPHAIMLFPFPLPSSLLTSSVPSACPSSLTPCFLPSFLPSCVLCFSPHSCLRLLLVLLISGICNMFMHARRRRTN